MQRAARSIVPTDNREGFVNDGTDNSTVSNADSAAAVNAAPAAASQPAEPVLWTHRAGPQQARIVYTSLGHLDDFANPAFRKLLLGSLFWSLAEDVKPKEKLP